MVGLSVPTWDPQTALLIGIILAEAVVLYVGYGLIGRVVGPPLVRAIRGRRRHVE
jgi:hypothetical protein